MNDAAALMDRIYRRQRHVYDATRKFYLLGRDDLIETLRVPPDGTVLEIACGTGRNLIEIARRYPRSSCHGLDISSTMLATARLAVRRVELADGIRLAEADAAQFDPETLFGRHTFDRVVISYALSMIPTWRDVLRRAVAILAPGGSLHVVDFGDQADLPYLFRWGLNAWLRRFHVWPRLALASFLDELARQDGMRVSSKRLYRGYAMRADVARIG